MRDVREEDICNRNSMCQPKRIAINNKQTVKNALVAVRSEQLLSTSWMDGKQVFMPSTSSTVAPLEITRHNETRKIPQIVADYTKEWGGG